MAPRSRAATDTPSVNVVCTQPRRLAARSVATRVAMELDTDLGHLVGYHVRFDNKTSQRTKLSYVTDGILPREAVADPTLAKYARLLLFYGISTN